MQMCVTGKPVDDDMVVPLSSIVEGPRSLRRQQASIARAALSCRVRLSAVLVDEPKRDGRAGHALAAAAATEAIVAGSAAGRGFERAVPALRPCAPQCGAGGREDRGAGADTRPTAHTTMNKIKKLELPNVGRGQVLLVLNTNNKQQQYRYHNKLTPSTGCYCTADPPSLKGYRNILMGNGAPYLRRESIYLAGELLPSTRTRELPAHTGPPASPLPWWQLRAERRWRGSCTRR